jgi:hypothetical protein
MEAFERYLEGLKVLGDWQRPSLPEWSMNVLTFAEMTDGIVWEGLLGWTDNDWAGANKAVDVLRTLGAAPQATLLLEALDVARARGHIGRAGLDRTAVLRDDAAFAAFLKAEESIEGAWEELWNRAEAYARANGWSEAS